MLLPFAVAQFAALGKQRPDVWPFSPLDIHIGGVRDWRAFDPKKAESVDNVSAAVPLRKRLWSAEA